ncbi:helix-turn-helix domain-containing protein [Brevibacterium aurantiacum]|uniref:Helix-turn-helix domain-containing protein n=1 Tax=Brevibacterium aurantiacum TaxID=273384 RepID=A0A556CAL5_BREAU|nr:XRE family transcriptional regulator [Brevibacterium aurantiacum]TSI14492.1 helix-turn-helix domain-containing protein [Brevibacterium aurantiacum]
MLDHFDTLAKLSAALDDREGLMLGEVEEVNSTFRSRLRTLRLLRDFTVRSLGSRAGVSASLVSNIENGRSNPSVATISKICDALGVEVADLFSSRKIELTPQVPADREVLVTEGGVRKSVLLRESDRGVSLYQVSMPPGSETGTLSNPSGTLDLITMIEGRVIVEFGEARVKLESGDVLRFFSNTAHSISNETAEEAVFHWLVLDAKSRSKTAQV